MLAGRIKDSENEEGKVTLWRMITKIEISGFKSFHDFNVELSPFVVVAGLNAAGKSNLFDAIQLVSRLSQMKIVEAFDNLRGEAHELFSQTGDGKSATIMHFAVELLLDRNVRDAWGGTADLKYTRLRYVLDIIRRSDARGIERLFVQKEELTVLRRSEDDWYKRYVGMHNHFWQVQLTGGRAPFISTKEENEHLTVLLHKDKGSSGRPRPAFDLESTMLSSVTNTDFPHALAVKKEMENWHFLQLNPVELRKPAAKFTARDFMGADGAGLAGALFRIKNSDQMNLKNISRDMANLIPGIAGIDVEEDEIEKKYVIKATMDDGRVFSSQVLSEGTLRLLALCTLKHDEQHRGVLCFEEPENGVNPMRLSQVLDLLHGLTTDFAREEKAKFPARQVLINTHSPGLVAEVYKMNGIEKFGSIFFARLATHIQKGQKTQHTRLQPVELEEMPQGKINFDPKMQQVERSVGKVELINYLESVRFELEPSLVNEP